MIDLAAHIEYLLMSHDCVVAPGLGAFLVHETPAYYDSEHCQFNPPMRSLGFNAAVTINDGLLAESIARRDRVSLDAARVSVDAAVASFRNQLELTGSLPIGNLGIMTLQDGALLFEPSEVSAVTMRYMGLGTLDITSLTGEQVVDDAVNETPARKNIVSIILKIAASLIIAVMACGLFFKTDRLIGHRTTNYASLDSGLRACVDTANYVSESLPLSREIELNIAMPAPEVTPEAPADVQSPVSEAASGRYLLVVASFADMNSAMKHIGNDTRLSVEVMGGNYRVYVSTAETLSGAYGQADALRAEFPQVWICRR